MDRKRGRYGRPVRPVSRTALARVPPVVSDAPKRFGIFTASARDAYRLRFINYTYISATRVQRESIRYSVANVFEREGVGDKTIIRAPTRSRTKTVYKTSNRKYFLIVPGRTYVGDLLPRSNYYCVLRTRYINVCVANDIERHADDSDGASHFFFRKKIIRVTKEYVNRSI